MPERSPSSISDQIPCSRSYLKSLLPFLFLGVTSLFTAGCVKDCNPAPRTLTAPTKPKDAGNTTDKVRHALGLVLFTYLNQIDKCKKDRRCLYEAWVEDERNTIRALRVLCEGQRCKKARTFEDCFRFDASMRTACESQSALHTFEGQKNMFLPSD